MRISLPIIIQVRSGVRASSSLTGHQHNFTLSYPVNMKSKNTIQSPKKTQLKTKFESWKIILSIPIRPRINSPEEHAHSGSTGRSVGRARSHIFPIQLTETAGALRAQHGPAEQAQGRMLPVIVCRLGAPEDKVQGRQGGWTSPADFSLKCGDLKDFSFPAYWKWLAWLRRAL